MTIEQAQIIFIVAVFGLMAAIGISKLCDWINARKKHKPLPYAEPLNPSHDKSPAPVGAGDEADQNA